MYGGSRLIVTQPRSRQLNYRATCCARMHQHGMAAWRDTCTIAGAEVHQVCFHQHSSKLRSCEVAEQLILGVQVGQLRGELDDERARADYLAQVAALHQLPSPCGMPAPAPSGNISRPRKTRVHIETLSCEKSTI